MKVFFSHWRIPNGQAKKDRGEPQFDGELVRYYRSTMNMYVPDPRGGATTCEVRLDNGLVFSAVAKCSRGDTFSYQEGRRWAYARVIEQMIESVEAWSYVPTEPGTVSMTMPKISAEYIGLALKKILRNRNYSQEFRTKLGRFIKDVKYSEV